MFEQMEQTEEGRVLLLRSCRADFTAHGGYRWPNEVGAECRPERWDPRPVCGDGLHGFLHGEGDAGLADWSETAQWLVFSAATADMVVIDSCKAKVAVARIEYVGKGENAGDRLRDCLAFMAAAGQLGALAMGVVREGGAGSTLTGGYGSTLIFRWYDYVAGRWRLATAEIDTLKAKTPYTVKDGKIVEASFSSSFLVIPSSLERGR